MNKICTSLEQSQKLIELGIDVSTADMHYSTWTILNEGEYILSPNQGETIEELQEAYGNQVIPAWSLTALLEILPNNEVTSTTVTRGGWSSESAKYLDIWFAEYETEKHDNDFSLSADNPIDACYEMIIKLKKQNLI